MPHALLLSPDDQAVNAITGVLEEMSVTCERPLDGVSAAQQLNSRSFDLVLVDCENLPAAKLIFDVCRRGHRGNNPIPIAIVDGRAGLPTAFRLGAELILTKPVAKDQARTTIRTAVGRLRKDVPADAPAGVSAGAPGNDSVSAAASGLGASNTEARVQAAAADSSQLTCYSDPAPNSFAASISSAASTSARAVTTMLDSAVGEHEVDEKETHAMPASLSPTSPSASLPASSLESPSTSIASVYAKAVHAPSDDPVLAELERTEKEELEQAGSTKQSEKKSEKQSQKPNQKESSEPDGLPGKPTTDRPTGKPAAKPDASVFVPNQPGQQKTSNSLIGLLAFVVVIGGFYTAYTCQPGFRAVAEPQIDRLLALAGMAPTTASSPNPAKPLAQLAPATAPGPTSPGDPNQAPAATSDSTASPVTSSNPSSPTGSAATSAPASVSAQPPATHGAATPLPPFGSTTKTAAPVSQSETSKPETSKPGDTNKQPVVVVANSANTPLPGETSAVILSSTGAEKRLAYSVTPKYPAEAHGAGAEGTVVLKAVVDENGNIAGLRVVEGNTALATAAVQAVMQWRYRPYQRDGKAQSFQTVVIVDFQRP